MNISLISLFVYAFLCGPLLHAQVATNAASVESNPQAAVESTNALSSASFETTGKVLALRDEKGNVSSIKLLSDYTVYHVVINEKSQEMAANARFKNVRVTGSCTEEKPADSAIPRKVLTISSFTLADAPPVPPQPAAEPEKKADDADPKADPQPSEKKDATPAAEAGQ